MPDRPVKHIHESDAFRALEQLARDFRERRCVGFFFFALYPKEHFDQGLLVEVKGQCLAPNELPDFRARFLANRVEFERNGCFATQTGPTEECIDPGDGPRPFSKGGSA